MRILRDDWKGLLWEVVIVLIYMALLFGVTFLLAR